MKRLNIETDILPISIVIFCVIEAIVSIGYGWHVALFMTSVLILSNAFVFFLLPDAPVLLIISTEGVVVSAFANRQLIIWYVILSLLCLMIIEHIIRRLKRKD